MDDTSLPDTGLHPADLPTLELTDPLAQSFDAFDNDAPDDDDGFDDDDGDDADDFVPVALRTRHDGWTPQKQHDFIAALAECGCVTDACAAVGMTARSAYKLRARPTAGIFRQAWDVALDHAVSRLTDAAFSRAFHGVSHPIFYQGEQVGERRIFNDRLAMFLMRYRDPTRYGHWMDDMEARRHPDGAGIVLAHALNSVMDAAHGVEPEADPEDPWKPLNQGPYIPPPPIPEGDPDNPMTHIIAVCEHNDRVRRKAALEERASAAGARSVFPVHTPRHRPG
ncbi:hypothetical protein H9L12_11290 [Sphingomonas rhizophila]|uniref:Uncharacterized protein n=1 Tax=Sphingomonas rhizophila TaxID=2071607 RepID=A0A7G9SAD8_9SPHN|nr:hypothetical protein [Sphingomonas rhizophila]QNN64813.1 hypothetical protein H9L12_11290 [Sphingomonas rhizophila]